MIERIYRTVAAYLRKPVRVPVVFALGHTITTHPAHWGKYVAVPGCTMLGDGELVFPCGTRVVSDVFAPAWRYPTRRENARDEWLNSK